LRRSYGRPAGIASNGKRIRIGARSGRRIGLLDLRIDLASDSSRRRIVQRADARGARADYVEAVRSLLARHWLDGLVVVLAAAAQLEAWTDPTQTPRALTAPAALLWTLPLLLRRRYPLAAPATVFAVLGAEAALPDPTVTSSQINVFALFAAFAAAGSHPQQRSALVGGAIGFVSLALIVLTEVPASESAVPIFLFGGGTWAIGRTLAERSRLAEDLAQRAQRLEREHANAVLAERARIARELHDVIAHSLSVMTVQAGAARLLLAEEPERAREPLLSVEETGRQTLSEMRRLLGVLRSEDDDATFAPQPGMEQLDSLVKQMEAAGLPVTVSVEGEERPLSAGVDLAAYRVVQEALTNVLRHAGSARAHVRIRYLPESLELEVANRGHVAHDGRPGHGLIGMRQRVALYGGELDAGPADGGYRVHARIPLNGSEP
jgi:signal transduction histidine kinase